MTHRCWFTLYKKKQICLLLQNGCMSMCDINVEESNLDSRYSSRTKSIFFINQNVHCHKFIGFEIVKGWEGG
jgi:hypothetical protein